MSQRLRVVVVGLTIEDAERLRARIDGNDLIEVAGVRAIGDLQQATTSSSNNVDALLLTPAALRRPTPRAVESDDVPVEHLTPRERAVLARVADGLPNREIASLLGISEHTVKFHLAAVFGKLGVSSRTEAVRRGLQLGLIEI
jgi:DNA-binding NarL/FixJ family response regulator